MTKFKLFYSGNCEHLEELLNDWIYQHPLAKIKATQFSHSDVPQQPSPPPATGAQAALRAMVGGVDRNGYQSLAVLISYE